MVGLVLLLAAIAFVVAFFAAPLIDLWLRRRKLPGRGFEVKQNTGRLPVPQEERNDHG